MSGFLIQQIDGPAQDELPVEVVERKGFGHPDTICDSLAEASASTLQHKYLELFGRVLHFNVDKILLRGGRSAPKFGGGTLLDPIGIYLAGRATSLYDGKELNLSELLSASARTWFGEQFSLVDPEQDIKIECLVRSGSPDLTDLFKRDGTPRANDTSIGIGFAPFSRLEVLVRDLELWLNSSSFRLAHSELGRDIKVMGIRNGDGCRLVLAAAIIDRHVACLDEYVHKTEILAHLVKNFASERVGRPVGLALNAADDFERGSIYLTVTGLSAEAGDDGEVGRGNRFNGLITPYRPMTLEAYSGKNSVTHTGRIYQACAQRIADRACSEFDELSEARCILVSRIGAPVTEPEMAQVQYRTKPGVAALSIDDALNRLVREELDRLGG